MVELSNISNYAYLTYHFASKRPEIGKAAAVLGLDGLEQTPGNAVSVE